MDKSEGPERENMKKNLLLIAVGFCLSASITWGGVIGSTDPTQFTNTVDWCQLDCTNNNGATFPTPTGFSSVLGDSGFVGLDGTGQSFYLMEQGSTFINNFAPGMGLVYNGSFFGNIPTDIALQFNQAEQGFGAYISTNYYGSFTATITLYDVNDVAIGQYTTTGTANGDGDGSALFLGAFDTSADVWGATMVASGIGPAEPDFAIGEGGFYLPATTTPEPGTLLLLAPALLGLAAFARKRI